MLKVKHLLELLSRADPEALVIVDLHSENLWCHVSNSYVESREGFYEFENIPAVVLDIK